MQLARRGQSQQSPRTSQQSRHGRAQRAPAMTIALSSLLLLLPCMLQSAFAQAATDAANTIPQLDYEALGGSLGLVGAFAGVELYDPSGKSGFIASASAAGNSTSSPRGHLFSVDKNGTPTIIASVQGEILSVAECGSNGGVYFGGSFSSINADIVASNIAVYFPANGSITTLGSGVDGAVHALACDNDALYVGGTFNRPVGASPPSDYLGAVAVWHTQTSTWSPVGFGGFRGSNVDIRSIAVNEATDSGRSLVFGGSFETYWLNETVAASTIVSVTTLDNGTVSITDANATSLVTSNGEVVDVYPSLGSSLIPISLATAEITSSASSSDSRYSSPSSVLCPAGEDGTAGSTWLARQGDQTSRITARLFAPLTVGGFRLGNTHVDGSGTRSFRITAVPSNEVLTLQYHEDPTSTSSPIITCSDSCPLSHDSGIEYEDFIIVSSNNNQTSLMTGFEITILSHYGNAAGLHILQMLSTGTIAFSIDTQNNGYGQGVCTSGPASVYGRSSSTHQPTAQIPWDHIEVVSASLSGTSEGALCAAVPTDADPSTSPTATWYPYVGQDGNYELHFFTPACAFDATCGQRGAVDVEVVISSNTGSSSTTTTINQEVDYDHHTLIYAGPINPISDNAQIRATMSLSSSQRPALAPGKGAKYYLVADKIIVIAKDNDGNGSNKVKVGTGMNSVNVSTTPNTQRYLNYVVGHGLFEWNLSNSVNSSSPTLDTSLTTPQQIRALRSSNIFDRLAFNLAEGARIETILPLPEGAGFVLAGDFESSSASGPTRNVMMVDSEGNVSQESAQRGLDGHVGSLAFNAGYVYAAGNFSSTVDGTLTSLHGRARRQVKGNWETLPGVDSTTNASSVSLLPNDRLLVAYADAVSDIWYPANSSMASDNGPLIIANLTSNTLSANGDIAYMVGSLSALLRSSSSGSARLTKDGLQPFTFAIQGSQGVAAPALNQSTAKRSTISINTIWDYSNRLRKRQSGNTLPAPSALPVDSLALSTEPVIFAGAQWKNTTSKEEVVILGGRFGTRDGLVADIGILHADGSIIPLRDATRDAGNVKTLLVKDDLLWIGRAGSENSALSLYNLNSQQWQTAELLTSNTAYQSETRQSVNAIIAADDIVIVAGYFQGINGNTACSGVCEWHVEKQSWSAYGSGIEGVAAAAGLSKTHLYLAGTFVFNNTSAYVMAWEYESETWTALSTVNVPGPALSISVDTDDSIFIAGSSTSGAVSYLLRWNGSDWSAVGDQSGSSSPNSLDLVNSSLQQILIAPTLTDSNTEYFSSNDKVLIASGQLNLADSGSASMAIFDGTSWYPFVLSVTISGAAGTVAGLFYPASTIRFGGGRHLAVGLVILVSMAIALGVVFLGVLIALIITLSKRHDDANAYPPVVIPPYDADYSVREATSPPPPSTYTNEKNQGKITPTPMLETIAAATVALSAGHPGVLAAQGVRVIPDDQDRNEQIPYSTHEQDDDTTSEDNSIYDDPGDGDESWPMRAVRYSFDAEREEELSINTGDMVEVLDESNEHWHIVRRLRDGRQGLVPSAFLT